MVVAKSACYCSNWGNWQYQAGVGNDPRSFRQFNQIKQANDYDADADYVLMWIPELGQVDRRYAHTPWCTSYFASSSTTANVSVRQ